MAGKSEQVPQVRQRSQGPEKEGPGWGQGTFLSLPF